MKKNACLRLFTLLFVLLVALPALFGCASHVSDKTENMGMSSAPSEDKENAGLGTDASVSLDSVAERKLIKTYYLDAETKDFDAATASLNTLITQNGGYVENLSSNKQSLHNTGSFSRHSTYTIRIPAENAEAFVGSVSAFLNLTTNRASVKDISETYYSIEAKLEELQVERASLLDILENADTKNDYSMWLTVHQRLSEVTQQIAVYQGQINRYDSQVAYSTVELSIQEVLTYSETGESNFGKRLGNSFVNGWKDFGAGAQNFLVWLAGAIPALLIIGAIVTGVVLLVRRSKKRKMQQPKDQP